MIISLLRHRFKLLLLSFFFLFTFQTGNSLAQSGSDTLDSETINWLSRVTSAGGAVSPEIVSAVDDYVKEVKGLKFQSINIRPLILRENWFCGNFEAAFVPLFRNPDGSGQFSGSPKDVNRNYDQGEYEETGELSGLRCNGTNRYLETGIIPHQTTDLALTDARMMLFSMSEGYDAGRTGCRFDGIGFYFYPRYTNGRCYFNLNGTSESSYSIPSGSGYISAQRVNNQLNELYYRDNLMGNAQSYSANYKPNTGLLIGAFNNSGNVNNYLSMRLGGYSLGKSFTQIQQAVHYNAVMRLMTRLGRVAVTENFAELSSELFTFTGRDLYANFRTRDDGYIQFELQDSSGMPVQGYSIDDCEKLMGDESSFRVSWAQGSDLARFVNEPMYLKLRIKNADLYTLQFRNEVEPVDNSVPGFKAGTIKQFFADTLLFRNHPDIARLMHKPVKHPVPVISPVEEWEGNYVITTYSNVGYSKSVEHDAMVYKLWLRCVNSFGRVPIYYESFDGINWQRPSLQLFKYSGSADNNILSDAPYPAGLYTVVDDSAYNQSDSSRRFKSVYNTHPTAADSRLNVSFSADGLIWIPYSGNPVRYIGEDLSSSGWNPVLGKYLGYFRDSLGIRKVGRYTSPDWINWTYTGTVLKPSPQDIAGTNFYNMTVLFRDSVYWGFTSVLKLNANNEENPVNPGRIDNTVYIALLFSRDGINFTRCGNLAPFINYGDLGQWDDQMIYTVGVPVVVGDEYFVYYNGFNYKHYTNGGAPPPYGGATKKSHIGMARIGLDRFVSLSAY